MEITDDYIVSIFYGQRQIHSTMIKKFESGELNPEIIEYLKTRFSDSKSLKETLYRIKYKIEVRPLCKTCRGEVQFIGKRDKGFNEHCSKKCTQSDKLVRKKCKTTCMEKYGEDNPVKSEIVQGKIKSSILKKYGVDNVFKSEFVKSKSKKTLLEKYGVENIRNAPHIKKWWDENKSEVTEKRIKTKAKNGTFSTSLTEEYAYIFLKTIFSDVQRQYKSEVYPFSCDFYIQDIDTYIELNCHWTHGKHPFDSNCKNDIDILNQWISKNTEFYNNAITTWTKRDVQKRNIAKQNNLKFLEFWSLKDLKIYFQNFCI